MSLGCVSCPLRTGFNRKVRNSGPVPCNVLLIGEAPGGDEARLGEPFVGEAGKLLNDILKQAGTCRDKVAVTNSVRCRPAQNRTPTPKEIEACAGRLDKTVKEVQPNVIIALGATAAKAALGKKSAAIGNLRGRVLESRWKIPLVVTYRPAYALRQGANVGRGGVDLTAVTQMIRGDIQLALSGKLAPASPGEYRIVTTDADWKWLKGKLVAAKVLAWDTETSGLNFQTDRLLGLSFCWEPGHAAYLPWASWKNLYNFRKQEKPTFAWPNVFKRQLIKDVLSKVLCSPNVIHIGHNIGFDILFVRQTFGFTPRPDFDTMLAHHLLNENSRHDLDTLTFGFTNMGGYMDAMTGWLQDHRTRISKSLARRRKAFNLEATKGASWRVKGLAPLDILGPYAAGDADCTMRLYQKFMPMLKADGLARLFKQIVMRSLPVLVDSEFHGVQLDIPFMDKLRHKYRHEAKHAKRKFIRVTHMKDLFDKPNLNSAKQLGHILFYPKHEGGLGFSSPRKTAKGANSTDKKTLDWLQRRYDHPAIKALLKFRKRVKWVSTYLQRVPDPAGRIHPHYSLSGTVTGRLNCKNPAVQNIPRESEMRQVYVAALGRTLIETDFAQAEFRTWGAMANDKRLLADVAAGKDIHMEVAAAFFDVTPDKVTNEQRVMAKNTVFGTMYGRGAKSIAEQFKTSEDTVKRLLALFFGRYPRAREWSYETQELCAKRGYVTNPLGRRRRLPAALLRNATRAENDERARALRQAVNSPIQSFVSDYTLLTACRCYDEFVRVGVKKPILVLEVHDSLVWEVDPADVDRVAKIITEQAARGVKALPTVPWSVDLKTGDRWGLLEPYGVTK